MNYKNTLFGNVNIIAIIFISIFYVALYKHKHIFLSSSTQIHSKDFPITPKPHVGCSRSSSQL